MISNATVIDVVAGQAVPGQNLVILDGLIQTISARRGASGADVIDASGAFICPGLIDGHVHLFLDGSPTPRINYLEGDEDARWRVALFNAELALSAGITTVRDCGGPGALVFRLQRAIARGDGPGPRILAAGSPITRPRGHCHFFGIETATPAEAERAVDQQALDGAVFVKLIASGGGLTPGTRPDEADLPLEIMRAAVNRAHSHNLFVAAHCHAVDSIVRALDAGVDVIEHASFTSSTGPHFNLEIAARIRDQGVVVSPTAISGVRIADHIRKAGAQHSFDQHAVARLEARRHHVTKFYDAGIRLLAGTDCGVVNTPFDSLVDELAEYVRAGMSCADALRSATSDSAEHLRQPQLGQVKTGYIADFLMLRGNPLRDINHLREPVMVVQKGKIVYDRRLDPARDRSAS